MIQNSKHAKIEHEPQHYKTAGKNMRFLKKAFTGAVLAACLAEANISPATSSPKIEVESLTTATRGATATEKAVRLDPPSPPPTVVHIGDSIGVMKFQYGNFAELIQAGGMELLAHDEKGARPMIWDECDRNATSLRCEGPAWQWGGNTHIGVGDGIRSLEHMSDAVIRATVVVIDLGQNTLTNRLDADTTRVIDLAINLSNQDGVPATIVMDNMAHTNNSYVGPAGPRNAILEAVASKFTSVGHDVRILDAAAQHFQLDSGGIHPTVTGAQDLARWEADQIAQIAYEN